MCMKPIPNKIAKNQKNVFLEYCESTKNKTVKHNQLIRIQLSFNKTLKSLITSVYNVYLCNGINYDEVIRRAIHYHGIINT